MNTRALIIPFLLLGMTAMQLTATEARPIGRETAADGARVTLEGTLNYQDAEWFLASDSELYQLLMGRYRHEKDLALTDGAQAIVDGFIHRSSIAPVRILSNDETMEFWQENRMPMWAGEGQRKNAAEASQSEGFRGRGGPDQMERRPEVEAQQHSRTPARPRGRR